MELTFIAAADGTHDWVTIPSQRYRQSDSDRLIPYQTTMEFVRITAGRGEREVCEFVVNIDVNEKRYLAISQEEMLKTKQQYRARGGVVITNPAQFAEFMENLIEAGKRAGFIG